MRIHTPTYLNPSSPRSRRRERPHRLRERAVAGGRRRSTCRRTPRRCGRRTGRGRGARRAPLARARLVVVGGGGAPVNVPGHRARRRPTAHVLVAEVVPWLRRRRPRAGRCARRPPTRRRTSRRRRPPPCPRSSARPPPNRCRTSTCRRRAAPWAALAARPQPLVPAAAARHQLAAPERARVPAAAVDVSRRYTCLPAPWRSPWSQLPSYSPPSLGVKHPFPWRSPSRHSPT